jgi:hypothetical protein
LIVKRIEIFLPEIDLYLEAEEIFVKLIAEPRKKVIGFETSQEVQNIRSIVVTLLIVPNHDRGFTYYI